MSYQRKLDSSPIVPTNASDNATEAVVATRETRLDHYKLRARIDVSKDDVQKVVPIAKVRMERSKYPRMKLTQSVIP